MKALLLLALVGATPQPGEVKVFGDWAVACDNGHRCEMTSLVPDGEIAPEYEAGFLSLVQEPGPLGEPTLSFDIDPSEERLLKVMVDGAPMHVGVPENGGLQLAGAAARKAIAAMKDGEVVQISDAADTMLALVSLKGSAAAMRYMDAETGRAGTVAALVAKGARPTTAVPPAPALPVLAAQRIGATVPPPRGARLADLQKRGQCEIEYLPEGFLPEAYALEGGATLILVPCWNGPYQNSVVPFVDRGGAVEVAQFDVPVNGHATDAPPHLVNAGVGDNQLSSFSKGRGLADCGSSKAFIWDGERFRLTDATEMRECRGSHNWLTVWRTTVR
jgi:hypothetical protein